MSNFFRYFNKIKIYFNLQFVTLYVCSTLLCGTIFWANSYHQQSSLSNSHTHQIKPYMTNFSRSTSRSLPTNNQLNTTQSDLFKPSKFKFLTAIKGGEPLDKPSIDLFSEDPQNHDIFASLQNYSLGLWTCFYKDWSTGNWNFYPLKKFKGSGITNISYYYNPKGDLQSQIMWLGTTDSGFYNAILNHADNNSINDKLKKPNQQIFTAEPIQSTISYIQANSFYASTFFVDRDHNFWMSAAGIGLFMSPGIFTKDPSDDKFDYYKHNKWIVINPTYSFLGTFNYNRSNINYISQDNDGNYYFGGRDYKTGLVKVTGTKDASGKLVFNKAKLSNIIANASINYVAFHNNLIYACTNGTGPTSDDGLYIYDIKKQTITIAPELKFTSVTKIIFNKNIVFAASTDGLYEGVTGSLFSDNADHNGISQNKEASGWQRISQFDRTISVNNLVVYTLYTPPLKIQNVNIQALTKSPPVVIVNTNSGIYEYEKPSSTGILFNNSVSGVGSHSYLSPPKSGKNSYAASNKMFFHYWSNHSFSGNVNLTNDRAFHQSFPVTAVKNSSNEYNLVLFFLPTFLDPNTKDKNKIPDSIIDQCNINITISEDNNKSSAINDNLTLYVMFYPDLTKLPKEYFIPAFSGAPRSKDKIFLNYDYSVSNNLYYPLIYCLNVSSVTLDLNKFTPLLLQNNKSTVGTLALNNHRSSIVKWKAFDEFNDSQNKLTITEGFYQIYLVNQLDLSYRFYLQVGGREVNKNYFIDKPFSIPGDKKSNNKRYISIFVPIALILILITLPTGFIAWRQYKKKGLPWKKELA